MSDHLPECFAFSSKYPMAVACICDRLRACEARVLGNRLEVWAEGYAFALHAARDAVAALTIRRPSDPLDTLEWLAEPVIVLAAIDALRGES